VDMPLPKVMCKECLSMRRSKQRDPDTPCGWRYIAYLAIAFGQTLVPVGAVPTSWRTASLSVVQP